MTPYYEDADVTLLLGDCRDVMAQMAPESVSCVMTSPPFFALRKYTCEPSIWGGDPDCPHSLEAQPVDGESYAGRERWQHDGVSRQETPGAWEKEPERQKDRQHLKELGERDGSHGGVKASSMAITQGGGATCALCGAWRGWLGLEPTVAMYVAHTIDWLRAVKRVLRKDGVVWLDIGDSRAGSGKGQMGNGSQGRAGTKQRTDKGSVVGGLPTGTDIAPKNLCLIPQRLSIAAQEDGWIVRNYVIIKARMPESAGDRMTRSYRVLLVLTKSGRYWWDAEAIKMPLAASSIERMSQPTLHRQTGGPAQQGAPYQGSGNANQSMKMVRSLLDNDGLRNCDDLWLDIPPAGWPSGPGFEHFATFAAEEPERCILASCPAEICVKCGKARRRVVKKGLTAHDGKTASNYPKETTAKRLALLRQAARERGSEYVDGAESVGWTDCGCGAGFEPGVCLDPFIGTGTSAIAARKLGRRCIGIDASEDYLQQAVTRLSVGDSGIRRLVEARKQGSEQMTLFSGPTGSEGGKA